MKNTIKILLLLVLVSPLAANALEVSLDCPKSAKVGSDVTCSINVSTGNTVVAGLQANVEADEGLTYKSYSKEEGWAGDSSSSIFLIYDEKVSGDKTVGSYTYTVNDKALESVTVALSGIELVDENGEIVIANKTTFDTITIEEKTPDEGEPELSSTNTLKSLTISGVAIEFDKNKTSYEVNVKDEKITITAEAEDSKAKVEGAGEKTLKEGTNLFEIKVTAEDGTVKMYSIKVERVTDEAVESPETGDMNIILGIIIAASVFGLGVVSYKKIKA